MESLYLTSMNISCQFGSNPRLGHIYSSSFQTSEAGNGICNHFEDQTIQTITTHLTSEIVVSPLKIDLFQQKNQEIEVLNDNIFKPFVSGFIAFGIDQESPFSSFNFISDDYKYDDDFEYDDFDDDFDEDFEPLPDDDLEDFPDPYSDDDENDIVSEEEIEIDPFEDFDDLDTDENTFVSDDDDVEDI
ncbi:MAG: hypothetical protein Q4C95_00225 [Planctomycetia bacterium]|nr:hypothetical protein [Planctomycetia bacterium]